MYSQLSENVHIALKTELTTNKYITLISYPSWCLFARHVSYNFSHIYPNQLPQLVPLCWTCFIQLFPQIPFTKTAHLLSHEVNDPPIKVCTFVSYIHFDQTLVNLFHGLLNCEIGGFKTVMLLQLRIEHVSIVYTCNT